MKTELFLSAKSVARNTIKVIILGKTLVANDIENVAFIG